ncbi:MAG: tetratricopeptide repeat protein [candidate division KSB1 bacterium]|nr:tetratricopeptide repeat protein [candidate division KSB1 bacterium]
MRRYNPWNSSWGFVLTLIVLFIFIFGCAPPAQKPTTEISPERQKAIADSLQRIYIFELDKNWSTGYEYYKNKMYSNAVKPFWKVAKLDTIGRYKDVWSKLADTYFKLGNADSAQLVCELGVKQDPNNVYLHRSLGHLLMAREQVEDAISEYEKVVELAPEAAEDFKILGNLYVRTKDWDKAISAYEKVIELNPQDTESQNILAQLYKQTGQDAAALVRMEEALKLDPQNTRLMYDLGKGYFDRGDYEKAEQQLRTLLKYRTDDYTAMEYLGAALQNQKKFTQAINVYNNVMKLKPDHKKVLTDIATCYKELGQFLQAREYVRKALKLDPQYGLAFITMGEIYETCVDKCMQERGKTQPEFDDKLVYKLAYDQYEKATKDLEWKEMAERRLNYLQELIPKKEDYFMHKNQTKPRIDCYQWIY